MTTSIDNSNSDLNYLINQTKIDLINLRKQGWCAIKLDLFIQGLAIDLTNPQDYATFMKECRSYLHKQILNR